MGADITAVERSQSRVFVTPFQGGPANVPEYIGHMAAGALDVPFGDVTRHSIPSDTAYGQFIPIAQTRGARDNGTLALQARYAHQISRMRELGEAGCPIDAQIHIGKCRDPKDFDGGWTLIEMFEEALITGIGIDQLGALTEDDENVSTEESALAAPEPYQVKRLTFSERAGTVVQNEVIAISVCDRVSCGDCADPGLGDEDVLALQLSSGGSPGLLGEVAYSQDEGASWADTLIDTLAANEEPTDAACVGDNYAVIADSESIHWAPIADILAGTEVWTEIATGFVAGNGPLAIWAVSPREVYIVGENGYIYRAEDVTAGVTVLDAGVTTTQNLNDVHAASSQVIVAVGESNAVVFSVNGGSIWSAVVGPAVGVDLEAVWARTEREWWVGTAGGELWYTQDQGATWTEKGFTGAGAGQVRSIVFATPSVGYMAHDTAVPAGRIFRTVNGGWTWYLLPEDVGAMPANDRINALAVPHGATPTRRANQVYGGGLDDAGTDGIIVKAA